MSSTLSDMCFCKSRTAASKSPGSMLLEGTAGPPLALYPARLCQVATCGLSGECLLNWAVRFGFQKLMSLFSFQRLNFIVDAVAVVGTGIDDLI